MPFSNKAKSLAGTLDALTVEGAPELTEHLADDALKCYACGHRCLINEGKRGICKVRFNEGGRLLVPANYVAALACDPTEKKPFFHVIPGSDTLTFGMLGCDLHCAYCQNWLTSQALRDDSAGTSPTIVSADRLVTMAKTYGQLGGVVDNILETVKMVHERGFWEEIVTLVIPGFNDSEDELRRAAEF